MRTKRFAASLALCLFAVVAPALAQQTTGIIIGRILDDQGAAIPGATVSVTNPSTGFNRTAVSDAEGVYRLSALPVGNYDLNVELPGFTSVDQKGVIVNVGQTITLDFALKVASVSETITVTGASPLIEASVSSVGGVGYGQPFGGDGAIAIAIGDEETVTALVRRPTIDTTMLPTPIPTLLMTSHRGCAGGFLQQNEGIYRSTCSQCASGLVLPPSGLS
jgi:hypothetical protein